MRFRRTAKRARGGIVATLAAAGRGPDGLFAILATGAAGGVDAVTLVEPARFWRPRRSWAGQRCGAPEHIARRPDQPRRRSACDA